MTKTAWARALVLAVATLALAAVPAQAHGAAPAREVDTRVLFDDDGALGYGGCGLAAEAGQPCVTSAEGFDLLVLDVREAWLGAEPAIVFRIVVQSDNTVGDRGLGLSLTAGGVERSFAATSSDGVTFVSQDLDLLQGPVDAFDGHPKAYDAWLRRSTLQVAPGDAITGITVATMSGGEPDDVMPGTWMVNGQPAPYLPADPDAATAEPEPGAYTVKGPAPLLTLGPAAAIVDAAREANVTVRVGNPLTTLAQKVQVTLETGPGVKATLDHAAFSLDPGAARQVTVQVAPDSASGNASLVIVSDLGARILAGFDIVVPANVTSATATSAPKGAEGNGIPAPSLLVTALGLVAALGVRRR